MIKMIQGGSVDLQLSAIKDQLQHGVAEGDDGPLVLIEALREELLGPTFDADCRKCRLGTHPWQHRDHVVLLRSKETR